MRPSHSRNLTDRVRIGRMPEESPTRLEKPLVMAGKEIGMSRLVRWSLRCLVLLMCLGGIAAVLVIGRSVSAGPPKDATYIGKKKCKICHFKQYRTWKKTGHAEAWETLSEKDRSRPACVRCHVTGYGRTGGFINNKNEEETPRLAGVQCEACHGPGSAHAEAAKEEESEERVRALINRTPKTCAECHNPHETHEEYEKRDEG